MTTLESIQADNSFSAFEKKFITELYQLDLEATEKLEDLKTIGLEPEEEAFTRQYTKGKLKLEYGEGFVSENYRLATSFLRKIGVR